MVYNSNNYRKQLDALQKAVKGWYEIPKADADAMTAIARNIIWPEFIKQGPISAEIKDIVESFKK